MNDIVSKIKRFIAVIDSKYKIENHIGAGMQTVIGLSVATVEELNPSAADIRLWALNRGHQQFLPTESVGGLYATALNMPGEWIETDESTQDDCSAKERFYVFLHRPVWLDKIRTLARLAEGEQPAIDDADLPMQAEVEGTPRIATGCSEQPAKPKKKRGRKSNAENNAKYARNVEKDWKVVNIKRRLSTGARNILIKRMVGWPGRHL